MTKVWVVCRREFNHHIRKLSFWLTTLGLPVFMFILGLVVFAIGFYTVSKSLNKSDKPSNLPLGIVDQANVFDREGFLADKAEPRNPLDDPDVKKFFESMNLPEFVEEKIATAAESRVGQTNQEYLFFESIGEAESELKEKKLRGVLHLPQGFPDQLEAAWIWYNRKSAVGTGSLNRYVRNQLLARDLPNRDVEKILSPLKGASKEYRFEESKKPKKARQSFNFSSMGMPFIFAVAMIMVVMFSSDRLLRGLMEEKQNRVIEILLSSVSADELMAGKVLGLGFVGLVQLSIWIVLAFLPAASLLTFFSLGIVELAVYLTFFILGYFLISTLMLGLGSMGSNHQEASQWALICSLLAMTPVMLWPLMFQDMDSLVVEVFTYFPFTMPMMAILRYGAGMLSMWQVGICLVILVLTNILAIKFGAKLFRLGILLTGKNPSPLTVWRMLKRS